jgi:hypothetical protein
VVVSGVDEMTKMLTAGHEFACGRNSADSTNVGLARVFMQVNEVGDLCWFEVDKLPGSPVPAKR